MEAGVVKGIEIYPADNLLEVIEHLNGKIMIKPFTVDTDKIFADNYNYDFDFSEVKRTRKHKKSIRNSSSRFA